MYCKYLYSNEILMTSHHYQCQRSISKIGFGIELGRVALAFKSFHVALLKCVHISDVNLKLKILLFDCFSQFKEFLLHSTATQSF